MQPYFFPYIGYFQLIASVDLFIVYDNIKYTKKGWINRNRILLNGKAVPFSLPLKSASDSLDLRDRELATDIDRERLVNQLYGAYRRAPRNSVLPALRSGRHGGLRPGHRLAGDRRSGGEVQAARNLL